MLTLPARYAFLLTVAGRPRTITEALALYGVKETPGPADTPAILEWADEVGVARDYRHDETPWCGLFAAVVVKRAGWEPVASPLWALGWANFGAVSDAPSLGDVMVFRRDLPGGKIGGHVGFYVGEDERHYHVLGGNQGDAVSIVPIDRRKFYTARRPVWRIAQPAGVKPYRLTDEGPVSVKLA